jgi:hypothetical protein
MDRSRWRKINGVDRARQREARLQAHYALQWPARIARAHVAPRPHDFHTNLDWNDSLRALTTHALPGGGSAALKISELTLVFGDEAGG